MQEGPHLNLDAPRDAGDLIATTLTLFARHAVLFLSVTLLVVAPVVLLVNGVWAGQLADGGAADVPVGAVAATAAVAFLMPVLVTALHVTIVRDLGDGRVRQSGTRCALPPHASRTRSRRLSSTRSSSSSGSSS